MNTAENYSRHGTWLKGLLLVAPVAGCDGSNPADLSPSDPGAGPGTGERQARARRQPSLERPAHM